MNELRKHNQFRLFSVVSLMFSSKENRLTELLILTVCVKQLIIPAELICSCKAES